MLDKAKVLKIVSSEYVSLVWWTSQWWKGIFLVNTVQKVLLYSVFGFSNGWMYSIYFYIRYLDFLSVEWHICIIYIIQTNCRERIWLKQLPSEQKTLKQRRCLRGWNELFDVLRTLGQVWSFIESLHLGITTWRQIKKLKSVLIDTLREWIHLVEFPPFLQGDASL